MTENVEVRMSYTMDGHGVYGQCDDCYSTVPLADLSKCPCCRLISCDSCIDYCAKELKSLTRLQARKDGDE
jgi:hypothetical protein